MAAPFGDGNVHLDEDHLFGSEGEIRGRTNTGYEPGKIPQHDAPSFRQIGPEGSGGDLNAPSMDTREGNLKFAQGT